MANQQMTKHFYTQLIKHLSEYPIKGLHINDIYDFAEKQGILTHGQADAIKTTNIDLDLELKKTTIKRIVEEIAIQRKDQQGSYYNEYVLKAEFFVYLKEIEELEFATKNAKEARLFSIAAIIISVLSMIIGTILSIYSINNAIEIDKSQFKELKDEISKTKYKDDKVIEGINKLKKQVDSLTLINSKLLPKQDKK